MHRNLTHSIEQYILELLEGEQENFVSLRRKELAEMFECVPSQINYVIRSRFRPEHGYLVESRRGENGYIRILKVTCESPEEKLEHIEEILEDGVSMHEAQRVLKAFQERGLITERERLLIEVALHNQDEMIKEEFSLPRFMHEQMRMKLLKRMLKGLMVIE